MKNLAIKLLAFQREVGAIPKDAVNPFFKSKYADINTYISVIKPILSKHGLVLLQILTELNGKPSICTKIIDADSGEDLWGAHPLPENPDPQKMGAIITYFRRYAIQSLLCLEAEDNDAQGVSPHLTPNNAINADKEEIRPTLSEEDEAFNAFMGEPVKQLEKISVHGNCDKCGSEKVLNPKTGKVFCKAKCWLKV